MVRQRYRWGVVRAVPAGSKAAAPPGPWRKLARPPSIPVEAYGRVLRGLPINPNSVQVTLSAAGGGQAQIGPQGLGTRWYPTMAAVSTTVGANDVATCALFLGPLSAATQQGATSFQGGGDTFGLNQVEMYPGQYVIAVWAGGTAGSVGTLVVYGEQTALDY